MSTTTTTTVDPITEMLRSPKRTKTEEGEVEERSLKELIEADRYLKGQAAGDVPYHGLRISKMVPPGTT